MILESGHIKNRKTSILRVKNNEQGKRGRVIVSCQDSFYRSSVWLSMKHEAKKIKKKIRATAITHRNDIQEKIFKMAAQQ